MIPVMVSLTDDQLQTVLNAAAAVPVERRDAFLQRVGAMLKLKGRFTDGDLSDVVSLARVGLVHHTDAA
jgi:hypothetical protein